MAIENRGTIVTPELKAMLMDYGDPLQLNFKFMIDWNSTHGLFADEKYVNSALAYLKRIGEEERYNQLVTFIDLFKDFVRNFDFLFLSCEGIADIIGRKPGTYPNNDDDFKLSFVIRETIDMRFQGIMSLFHYIWYDHVRGVEVIPANLRRFNCKVLMYSSGYYNELLYNLVDNETVEENPEKAILPTIDKLNNLEDKKEYLFNYVLAECQQCSINHEETGKGLFGEISNEMNGDFAKNSFVINYRLSWYTGKFRSILGNYDAQDALVILAGLNKNQNKKKKLKDLLPNKDKLKKYGKGIVTGLKKQAGHLAGRAVKTLQNSVNVFLGKFSVIGDYFNTITNPEKLTDMVGAVATAAFDKHIGNKLYDAATGLANMMLNFNQDIENNIMRKIDGVEPQRTIELEEPITTYQVEEPKVQRNIEYQSKINRTTF